MKWILSILVHEEKVRRYEIGTFDTLEEAREKQDDLKNYGWDKEANGGSLDRYLYYPPHSILKYQINERR